MSSIKYISHRGNIQGKNLWFENSPEYIQTTLNLGYEVEIDLRIQDGKLYLGHDVPQYEINEKWLKDRSSMLWIHAKDAESALWLINRSWAQFFCHENDKYTLTSNGWLWCHDWTTELDSRCVVPLLSLDSLNSYNKYGFGAICSDYIKDAKDKFK